MSRLCAIPFTTDVPGAGGGGTLSAGPGGLTVSGAGGSWSVDLTPRSESRGHSARWLRRGLTGTLLGLGVGVTALALNLPPGEAAPGRLPSGPVAGPSEPEEHTEVVPPVVRTVDVGTTTTAETLTGRGGTP
jgi:hypothetical protein